VNASSNRFRLPQYSLIHVKGKFAMAISRQVFIHEGPGGSFESMWVGDAEGGTKPGILLFPNILGTKEWDFAKAEELAALGYTLK
jgi:hypothetical protein